MGFYYALEKKRFKAEWKKIQQELEDAGMDENAIRSMYTFDWELFLSRRNYNNHTQTLPENFCGDNAEDRSTLFQKYPTLSVTFDIEDFPSRYAWVDTITDPRLTAKLAELSSEDLELLTALVLEGYEQSELAKRWGCSQSAISQRLKRIKKLIKSYT